MRKAILFYYRDLFTGVGDGPDVENVIRQSSLDFEKVLVMVSSRKKRDIKFRENVEVITTKTVFHLAVALVSRRNEYQLAHLFCGLIPTIPFLIILLSCLGKKIVYSSFGQLLPKGLTKHYVRKRLYTYLFLFPCLRLVNAIHVSSDYEGRNLPDNIRKIKSYLPVFDADCDDDKSNSYPHREYNFLFFGRFDSWQKGLDILIPALAIYYKNEVRKKRTCISGHASHREEHEIKKLVKDFALENFVDVLPNVTIEERTRLYRSTNFLVHPSRVEGFARSMRDAINARVPLITTLDSNVPDALLEKNTGLACAFDHEELADLLSKSSNLTPTIHNWREVIVALSPAEVTKPLIKYYHDEHMNGS